MSFDLENFLPYRLSVIANLVSQDLSCVYANYDLTRTQWRVMAVISEGTLTAGEISHKTLMDKTTISRAVKQLIERKFVVRMASQIDGRSSPLRMTRAGLAIFRDIVPKALEVEQVVLQKFTHRQRESLEQLINVFLGSL